MEAVRLRIKDIELERGATLVRDGKGGKDRITMLPDCLVDAISTQIRQAKALHDLDLSNG